MARGRMINVTIAEDEEFNAMSIDAQFVFMRTLPHLDRDGLIVGNTSLLWAKVAPLLTDYAVRMESIVFEWIDKGFAIRYNDGKRDVIFFPGFRKNQFGMRYEKEAPSQFSPPPGYIRTKDGLVENNSEEPKEPSSDDKNSKDVPSTDLVRTEGVLSRVEVEVEVEEKAATHARTHENTRNEKMPTAAAALPEPVRVVEKESGKYQNFIDSYERIWGLTIASPYQAEKIEDWAKRVAISAWEYALQQAADNRKNGNWRYFETILNRVEVEGVTAQSAQKQQAAQSSPKLIDARDRDDIPDYLREALQGR